MPPAAAAAQGAPHNFEEQAHRKQIATVCSTPLSVVLNVDPHASYLEWRRAYLQRVSAISGGLEAAQNVATNVNVPAAPAMGALPVMTPAQYLQHHLRSLIRISIKPDSPAWKLIEHKPHASGVVAGQQQAFATLEANYYVPPKPDTPSDSLEQITLSLIHI